METVNVFTINGDFVTCNSCGKVMLLPHGADKCPLCKTEGCLKWSDENLQETDLDGLTKRHCNLRQYPNPKLEEFLSAATLREEFGK